MTHSIFKIVKSQLTQNQIISIVLGLLPHGESRGSKYYPLNPTRNDTKPGSLVIELANGCFWRDFATDAKGGDIISLYAYVKGISQYEAARELEVFCDADVHFAEPAPKQPKGNLQRFAKAIWDESKPAHGVPVEKYLRVRGYAGNIPDSIRCHSNLKHSETSTYHPAMVAAITIGSSNEVIAIHRTFLNPDGSGKAAVDPNKKMLGAAKGGSVKLGMPFGEELAIAEGIETALSFYLATGTTTWAALSAVSMQHIILPPLEQVSNIIIVADNDEAGVNASNHLATRLRAEGYAVSVAMPEQKGWDFNDVLLRGAK
ncbi:MAG: toprim protein [Candidatus Midichloriaceae bacterium]|jgi:hypothetical protein|nr:toprim protein [Candidatus Midichloriaceae bacterium]